MDNFWLKPWRDIPCYESPGGSGKNREPIVNSVIDQKKSCKFRVFIIITWQARAGMWRNYWNAPWRPLTLLRSESVIWRSGEWDVTFAAVQQSLFLFQMKHEWTLKQWQTLLISYSQTQRIHPFLFIIAFLWVFILC